MLLLFVNYVIVEFFRLIGITEYLPLQVLHLDNHWSPLHVVLLMRKPCRFVIIACNLVFLPHPYSWRFPRPEAGNCLILPEFVLLRTDLSVVATHVAVGASYTVGKFRKFLYNFAVLLRPSLLLPPEFFLQNFLDFVCHFRRVMPWIIP